MIKHANEMVCRERQIRGGKGLCQTVDLMQPQEMFHCRTFGTIQILQGCSIGSHEHTHETEYYWILEGEGIVTEADGEKVVSKGDLVITGGGASHAIRNEKSEPLVFLALILLEK
jgi:mannose-6-phosphate isomerase-like protein (cupin superfamily)